MRMSRKAGLLISAAACGVLAVGAAGTALASMDDTPGHSTAGSPHKAPLPATDALKAQAKSLGDIAGVLHPVSGLINDALTAADNGKLPPDQITAHTKAIRKAINSALQAGSAAAPSVPSVSQPDNGSRTGITKSAAELRTAALNGLQAKSDALLKAMTTGDAETVTSAMTNSMTALANVIASIALGGLPAPDLPGLPTLPRLPGGIA